MPVSRGRARPKPESTVHMHPCVMFARNRDDVVEWIERAGVDLSGLGDRDLGPLPCSHGVGEFRCDHASVLVGGHADGTVGSQSDVAESGEDARMSIAADENMDLGRSEPPGVCQL
jgi:hypothetical protein